MRAITAEYAQDTAATPRESGHAVTQLAVTQLIISRFRNYATLSLDVEPKSVVLVGRNGAGKTNILEALSLLSPGRGLRQARLHEIEQDTKHPLLPASGWAVSAELFSRGLQHHIATGADSESKRDTRIIKINGERMRKQATLCQYVSVQWLTPQMDSLFLEGNTVRRRFFDRLVYSFDPEHAVRVAAYEQAMRERNNLLKDRHADAQWLFVLEAQMAALSVAIAVARQQLIALLRELMDRDDNRFSLAVCSVSGLLESWLLQGISALDAEVMLAERLRDNRGMDAARGRASEGAHKSRFEVIYRPKNRPAELCSTGEQKSLLLALIIEHAKARIHACSQPPILLLDEVVSHLDVDARKELFDALIKGGMQAWMTGTDAADFLGLEGFATRVIVQDGNAKKLMHTA